MEYINYKEDNKLNLQWVSNVIGDDYKKWNKGDIVKISAQTGTGKTYFITGDRSNKGLIDYLEDEEQLIYICNRTELKRQIKLDLLKKYNMEIPYEKTKEGKCILDINNNKVLNIEELDGITKIKNIIVTSYHAISYGEIENIYLNGKNNLESFKYIICDECHFFLSDAGFNNKTYLCLNELINREHDNAIKIFISATMEEINDVIDYQAKIQNSCAWGTAKNQVRSYTTGIDYRYLDVKYFKKEKDILNTIKNDTSDDKWLFFVRSIKEGEEVLKNLNSMNVSATFINANTKESDEKKKITERGKFNSKVLITTKCLDNGVNIKDSDVRNLIIMTFDKVTFIQELGRKRVNINDPDRVNLYIPMFCKKSFMTLFNLHITPKLQQYEEYVKDEDENKNLFKSKYNNNYRALYDDIFYLAKNNTWEINNLGIARVLRDSYFVQNMIEKFDEIGEYAYILEQLEWLGLRDTFDERKLLEDVVDDEEIKKTEKYLAAHQNQVILNMKERAPLICKIGLIDKHNSNFKTNRITYIKNIKSLNDYLGDQHSQFRIKEFETSRMIDGKKKKFKNAWKIISINESV